MSILLAETENFQNSKFAFIGEHFRPQDRIKHSIEIEIEIEKLSW